MNAWCLYDWANSAFATTVMAAILPIYFSTVAAGGLPGARATAAWGLTSSISLALAAILSPVVGAAADLLGRRKTFLLVSAAAGIAATALLATVGENQWPRASLFYVLAHVPFVVSFVCYDSLLPHVARPGDLDRVSARGFAVGYVGGGLLLVLNAAMVLFPSFFHLSSPAAAMRASFLTVSAWWAIFTIPLACTVPEPPRGHSDSRASLAAVPAETFRRLAETFREIRSHREAWMFLVAFWLYADGIGTIVKMATIYGSEVGIGRNDLIGALVLVQFVGAPFSILFGRAAKRIGARSGIFIGLAVYALLSVGAFFLTEPWHFWLIAFFVGTVQGGTQALSRSFFASLTPPERSGEWFGFFSVSLRFAGIVGPLLFVLAGRLTGSSRPGALLVALLFLSGALLLARVRPSPSPSE
ncbi:MAG: MFS transporter [Candidatus Eisenbacteria bacterium]